MSKLPIISAEERLNQKRGIKGCIFGKSGIGKTSLLWTLDPQKTLFVDLEAGDLAVENWSGDCIRPKTWQDVQDFAVFIGGANPALSKNQVCSQSHYDAVCKQFSDPKALDKYETIFIDSLTVAGRLCFGWCKDQPQSFSEKTGKADIRGTYGLQGQEMLGWLTHLQHTRDKNIWFVGILDEKTDEFGRRFFMPQIEGSKTGLELPGIVDQVITMAEVNDSTNDPYRAFINHTINPYGYPAKDRSGRLDLMEEPNLTKLMEKIKSPLVTINQNLITKFNNQITGEQS
ncbi:MAG: ATP-binding protein [Rickettsiales bacterium]